MYGAKYLPPIVRSPLLIGSSVTSPNSVRTYRNMQGTFDFLLSTCLHNTVFYFYLSFSLYLPLSSLFLHIMFLSLPLLFFSVMSASFLSAFFCLILTFPLFFFLLFLFFICFTSMIKLEIWYSVESWQTGCCRGIL